MMKRNERGITLIELVMAIVILTVIAIPTATMIGAQIQGMAKSSDLTVAGNVARLTMEQLNNTPYASIAASGSSVITPYTVNWTVATVVGANGAERKDITLTVQRTGSGANLLTLYGSITKNVTYVP